MKEEEKGGPEPLDERMRKRLFGLAFRLTGDIHLSEDVAQETLVRALREGGRREIPWLFRVAVNLVRSERRRRVRRRTALSDSLHLLADERASGPLHVLEAVEERREFYRALGSVPDREREALLFRFGEGLSCSDVAEILGMTPNAVSCLLHRAKGRMRGLLAPRSEP